MWAASCASSAASSGRAEFSCVCVSDAFWRGEALATSSGVKRRRAAPEVCRPPGVDGRYLMVGSRAFICAISLVWPLMIDFARVVAL